MKEIKNIKAMDIYLYGPIYRGKKVTFNSKKGRGEIIEGIAIQVDRKEGIVILRDSNNFVHCTELKLLKVIDDRVKGIDPKLLNQ